MAVDDQQWKLQEMTVLQEKRLYSVSLCLKGELRPWDMTHQATKVYTGHDQTRP